MARLVILSFFVLSVVVPMQWVDAGSGPSIPGLNVRWDASLSSSRTRNVLFIVTHDTWGSRDSTLATMQRFQRGEPDPNRPESCPRGCGTEWWVMADGTVYHAVGEGVTPHCGGMFNGCNRLSVGIEFEGFTTPKPEAQKQAGLALIRFLQDRYCLTSDRIYAHANGRGRGGREGTGIEGKEMEVAGKDMGHSPPSGCVNIDPNLGFVSPGTVDRVVREIGQRPPPSLAELFRGDPRYASTYWPTQSFPLGGLQGLFNAFGAGNVPPAPLAPFSPPPSQPAVLESLAHNDFASAHDADSRAAESLAQKYPGSVVNIIVPSGSATSIAEVRDDSGKVLDVVTVAYDHIGAPSTFTSPAPVESGGLGAQSVPGVTSGIYAQLVDIMTKVRSILTTLVEYLRGSR